MSPSITLNKINPITSPSKKPWDVIIVGGGITGIGVLRDLALHGYRCLLLEKETFISQTSSKTSKMLHGGIRYLETFDFDLVEEALQEKHVWLNLAPHLCQEVPFHLPLYKNSKYSHLMLKIGLNLYDGLSHFRNRKHYFLSAQKTLSLFPQLRSSDLKSCGVYFDAVMDDKKLGLACLQDALRQPQTYALEGYEVTEVQSHTSGVALKVFNQKENTIHTLEAQDLVVTAGPFTDELLQRWHIPWENRLLPSRGSHLWIKKESFPLLHPLVMQSADNRVFFAIPHSHAVLIGTTETITEKALFNLEITIEEKNYLLQNLQYYFPGLKIIDQDILGSFAGIRPLIKAPGKNMNEVSRHHQIYRPQDHLYVILGGKYTTFRKMAQDLAQQLLSSRKEIYHPQLSLSPLQLFNE